MKTVTLSAHAEIAARVAELRAKGMGLHNAQRAAGRESVVRILRRKKQTADDERFEALAVAIEGGLL